MRLRHPALVVAAAAVTLGAVLTALAASSEGSLWKMLLVALALGLPGALAATEHPRNPVGWLLLATACVLSAMGLAGQASPAGSAGEWAAWCRASATRMEPPSPASWRQFTRMVRAFEE